VVRATIGTVLVVLGLEFATRVVGLRSIFFIRPEPTNCLQRGTALRFEFRPTCTGELSNTFFRTNPLGLRGGPVREDGSIRILSIGDSCTWGWGVGQDEAYPTALQRLLDERYGAGRYQVLNAGVPGYTSYEGLIYLRERGLPLKPAIVIAGYGFNETFHTGDIETQLDRYRRFRRVILVDDFLVEHSTLYHWLRGEMIARAARTLPVSATPDKYGEDLARIAALVTEHGARLVMLNFLGPPGPDRPYPDTLLRVTRDAGIPLVTYEGPTLDIVHPTADGDRILAARILARLEAEGYVGRPPAAGMPTS
jgi:lysophospholipase L1-like esterase